MTWNLEAERCHFCAKRSIRWFASAGILKGHSPGTGSKTSHCLRARDLRQHDSIKLIDTMAEKKKVLIIGGGVIGCAAAYYLARKGISATVIDKGAIGHGCSYGNAGWLVPAHSMPLPAPGALRQAAKWMLRRGSPLYIQPRPSIDMVSWLVRFLCNANETRYRSGARPLVGLAKRSLELIDSFVAGLSNGALDFRKNGLMYVCKTSAGLEHSLYELEIARDLGCDGEELSSEALLARNPILREPVKGGVYFAGQGQIEPLRFVEALAAEAKALGAEFLPQTEVFEIESKGSRIGAVLTTRGRIEADEFVLAAGSWTRAIAKTIRLRAPIEAGKGYALIYDDPVHMPDVPLLLVERKVAVTPRDGSIRCAGTMELAGMNEQITPMRVRAISRAMADYLHVSPTAEPSEVWRGLRPCTPDGLPMIGRPRKFDNLVLAAGHAMLGLTSSTGTGELVAELISGEKPLLDPRPFCPDRF